MRTMSGHAAKPRLQFVLGELQKAFRPHRPIPVPDTADKRHEHTAMCCVCDWQRECGNLGKASDTALIHGRSQHGDPFLGFVRFHAR